MENAPLREQSMRHSTEFREGVGQDDQMPSVPSMSIEAA